MRVRARRGQAAVEGLLAIPVLMVLFMIGFELWGLCWDAQYVSIRSRYYAVEQADAQMTNASTCDPGGSHKITATSSITFPASQLPLIGSAFGMPQNDVSVSNVATIYCSTPAP